MGLRTWWRDGHPLVSRWTHDPVTYDLTWIAHVANFYHHHTRWVRPSFWLYIWRAPQHYAPNRPKGERYYRDWQRLGPWRVRWCRLKGHPNGIIYYNSAPEAMEPDYRCQDCHEEIY